MHVTFRQLRLFLALADTGSVSAAARALHVTQPTASMQLRDVADAVGLPLYEVVGKRIYLTDAGRELADTAREISATWESFEQGIDQAKGLQRGKLRIAVVSTAQYFMPRIIGMFCRGHPAVDVSLEILNRDGVVQRLRNNTDDLYIMSRPPSGIDLSDDIFMDNPLVLIASATDSLAGRRKIPVRELKEQRFVLRETGSGTRMAADQFFRKMRFRPNIRLELGSNEAIKEAVAGGLGLGIVSRHALHGLEREHGVAMVDVKEFPVPSSWHIVHPAKKRLSPIAAAFKAQLLLERQELAA